MSDNVTIIIFFLFVFSFKCFGSMFLNWNFTQCECILSVLRSYSNLSQSNNFCLFCNQMTNSDFLSNWKGASNIQKMLCVFFSVFVDSQNMFLKVTILRKGFIANDALEWLFTWMDSFVYHQFVCCYWGIFALVAPEWLDAMFFCHMILKRGRSFCWIVTICTLHYVQFVKYIFPRNRTTSN